MRLWICEKPKLAAEVALNLSKLKQVNSTRKDGYFVVGDEVVTWLYGHLLQLFNPEDYSADLKSWRMETLPIIPDQWKLKVRGSFKGGKFVVDSGAKKQFEIIQGLLTKCKSVVHTGDPDREGQLLVDEILNYCRYDMEKVERCLVTSYNEPDMQKSIQNLKSNLDFQNLSNAALCRAKADFLIGINLTRLNTILGQRAGVSSSAALSVGRVQTPVLNMIVKRDLEIESFVPVHYFNVNAIFEKDGSDFKCQWMPKGFTAEVRQQFELLEKMEDDAESVSNEEREKLQKLLEQYPYLDAKGRLTDGDKAKQLKEQAKKAGQGTVVQYHKEQSIESRLNQFTLSELISELGKQGYSAKEATEAVQRVYEGKYITYPRTDDALLPVSFKERVPSLINAVVSAMPELAEYKPTLDYEIKTKVWTTKEMEKHAIIPTGNAPKGLSGIDKAVYETVAKRFFSIFMSECLADKAKIVIDVAGENYVANGKIITHLGWKELYANNLAQDKDFLPVVKQGDVVKLKKSEVNESKTSPPPLFVEADMPKNMTKPYLMTEDLELRKQLNNIGGIGTEATRPHIIENIIHKGYVEIKTVRKKRYVTSTPLGRSLISVLPEMVKDVKVTAEWENELGKIAEGQAESEDFMLRQQVYLKACMSAFKNANYQGIKSPVSKNDKGGAKSQVKVLPKMQSSIPCPECSKLKRPNGFLTKRTVLKEGANKGRQFYSCSNGGNACNFFAWAEEFDKQLKK